MRHPFVARIACVLTILGLALLTGCSGGGSGDSTPAPAPSPPTSTGPVASVRVAPATAQIAQGASTTFKAEALDATGAVVSGKTFQFSLSNTTVASLADPAANPVTVTALMIDGVTQVTATDVADAKFGSASL